MYHRVGPTGYGFKNNEPATQTIDLRVSPGWFGLDPNLKKNNEPNRRQAQRVDQDQWTPPNVAIARYYIGSGNEAF